MHAFNRGAYIHAPKVVFDVLFFVLSFLFILYMTDSHATVALIKEKLWVFIVSFPIYIILMVSFKMYNRLVFNYYDRLVRHVLFTISIMMLPLIGLTMLNDTLQRAQSFVLLFVVTLTAIMLAQKVLHCYISTKKMQTTNANKIIIVGETSVIQKFEYFLKKTYVYFKVLGYMSIEDDDVQKEHHYLGKLDFLETYLRRHVVDEVVFAISSKHMHHIEKYVLLCEEMGITARIVLDAYRLNIAKSHVVGVGTLPMLTYHTISLNQFELLKKRIIDIIGACIGLLLTGFLLIFLYPIIKLDSPGPLIFKQKRVGINGRIFHIYKFRTMYIDAEERKKELMSQNKIGSALMFKMDADPRITRVGHFLRKTSLDEFPQFFNVLIGDMSLVGTRPPTLDEVKHYDLHHYRRISIKPGLTGMWQTEGRSNVLDFDAVVQLDTHYIDQWSIRLDLQIIFKTIAVVLLRKGAS